MLIFKTPGEEQIVHMHTALKLKTHLILLQVSWIIFCIHFLRLWEVSLVPILKGEGRKKGSKEISEDERKEKRERQREGEKEIELLLSWCSVMLSTNYIFAAVLIQFT